MRPLITTVATAILLLGCAVCACAERTASDLLTAMRFNDSLLQQCLLEGNVVQKILPPPPPRPHTLKVVVAGGQDISQFPGTDRIPELMNDYGTASGVPLSDVPADYLPLVKLIRDGKVVLKTVKDDRPEPTTHRSYTYTLAQFNGDVALHLYGGDRHRDALKYATTTQGNKQSSLEYFAGTWERVDDVSKYSVNLLHEHALWYCFALGVGFGERVQSATLQSKRGNLFVLDAKVSIWPEQTHDARLVVDSGGLVREANINCINKRISSSSSGATTIPDTGSLIASRGRIEVKTPKGRELHNLAVELIDVRSSLEKDDFLTLCDLSITDGLPVYYYKNGYSSKRVLMDSPDKVGSQAGYTLLIPLAICLAVAVFLGLRRLTKRTHVVGS